MKAAKAGGLNKAEVKEFLESGEDKMTIKNKMRQTGAEVDGVPHIVICGSLSRCITDIQGENVTSLSKVQSRKTNISKHSFKSTRNSIDNIQLDILIHT